MRSSLDQLPYRSIRPQRQVESRDPVPISEVEDESVALPALQRGNHERAQEADDEQRGQLPREDADEAAENQHDQFVQLPPGDLWRTVHISRDEDLHRDPPYRHPPADPWTRICRREPERDGVGCATPSRSSPCLTSVPW